MATDATGTATSPDGLAIINPSVDAPSGVGQNSLANSVQTALLARITKALLTTVGDIIYASGASTPARLGIGSSGDVLTVAGGVPAWAAASSVPPGVLMPYAAAAAPTGYLLCDGGEYLRTTYAALDAVISTTYGSYTNGSGGAGTTHFRTPDMRGRVPAGYASGGHADVATLAGSDGSALASRRPKHKHTVVQPTFAGTNANTGTESADHTHTYWSEGYSAGSSTGFAFSGGGSDKYPQTLNSGGRSAAHTHNITPAGTNSGGTVGPQTGAEPTDTLAYLVVNYIIKA